MKEEVKYRITLTEGQMKLLSKVLDKQARLIVGQLDYAIEEELLRASRKHRPENEGVTRLYVQQILKRLSYVCWGTKDSERFGVGYSEDSDTLWDMQEVIRHQLWKDDEFRNQFVVSSNPAVHWNKKEPLIEVEKVGDE